MCASVIVRVGVHECVSMCLCVSGEKNDTLIETLAQSLQWLYFKRRVGMKVPHLVMATLIMTMDKQNDFR